MSSFAQRALSFGNRTIGVVLTGGLEDGTAGLAAIKGCCGIAVVQDPVSATVPSMPQTPLRHVVVDHCVPLHEMAPILLELVAKDPLTRKRGEPCREAES
jgi:two-component system chemotaxis response regulator CheB